MLLSASEQEVELRFPHHICLVTQPRRHLHLPMHDNWMLPRNNDFVEIIRAGQYAYYSPVEQLHERAIIFFAAAFMYMRKSTTLKRVVSSNREVYTCALSR
jgi:hypothetical protein